MKWNNIFKIFSMKQQNNCHICDVPKNNHLLSRPLTSPIDCNFQVIASHQCRVGTNYQKAQNNLQPNNFKTVPVNYETFYRQGFPARFLPARFLPARQSRVEDVGANHIKVLKANDGNIMAHDRNKCVRWKKSHQ